MERIAPDAIELRLEEQFRYLLKQVALHSDPLIVRQFVVARAGQIPVKLLRYEAQASFDIIHDSEAWLAGKAGTFVLEEPLSKGGERASCDLGLPRCLGDCEAFEDRDGVSLVLTWVDDKTGRSSVGDEGHSGIESDVHVLDLERLKHDCN